MTATPLQLVVGLGNPGPRYAETRHNAGFWLVDRLAAKSAALLRPETRYKGECARTVFTGRSVWLLKPQTFMNLSGQSIAPLAAFYKIPPEAILVIHDELDLPPGVVRLKRGGGHGGHNGLRDTIRQLGSSDFLRLRIGIGHPGVNKDVVGYVLERPPASERQQIDNAIAAAVDVFPDILEGRLSKAMQVLHSLKVAAESSV